MLTGTPKYRLHRPSGQAVVTLNGRDFYLGKYGSDPSRAEYDRLVADWLSSGRQLGARDQHGGSSDITVNELLVKYLHFVDLHYQKNGQPTAESRNVRLALKTLRRFYGQTAIRAFGPLALKAIRDHMIREPAGHSHRKDRRPLCRREINKRVGRIVRLFKWGVEAELVPTSVYQALRAVSGLRRGRSGARESLPVRPVPDSHVEAILPHVARQVWAMIELQRLTAMRSGEVCEMRTCDVDTWGRVWVYTPEAHKTELHGRERPIYLGPRAQMILKPWLRTELAAYLFSPRDVMQGRRVELRRKRDTPVQPSLRNRRKRRPWKEPGERYVTDSYRRAIQYGCDSAGVPHWHPHQLRHNVATWLRKEFGLEVARIILGHASASITETYAEIDREKALEVMERVDSTSGMGTAG